jgi:hypothetical protein
MAKPRTSLRETAGLPNGRCVSREHRTLTTLPLAAGAGVLQPYAFGCSAAFGVP